MGGALTAMCGLFNPSATGYVNSVQQVSITIAAGSTTGTATISTVDTAKSFIVYQGQTTPNTATTGTLNWASVTLTNSTTITATRNTSDATFAVTINCTIIDAKSSLVSSVQYGTVSMVTATSNTATISSVDTSKSAVLFLGMFTGQAGGWLSYTTGVTLTNATTITGNAGTSGTYTISFVVIEFASAAIQSIQQISDAYTTSNTTDTKTISSVNTSNTMIGWGGQKSTVNGTGRAASYWYTLALTSSTNINLVRQNGATDSRTVYYTVIEFVSGVLKSSQRGVIALTSATSNTATISSVDTAKSFGSFVGWNVGSTSGVYAPRLGMSKNTLTDATTVTATRNTSDANVITCSYEVIEFN